MIIKSDASDVKPFTGLSPDVVLDAASSVGLDVDGRLFALNSYENRVYQLGSPAGSLVRGHEFHYATLISPGDDAPLAELADGQGRPLGLEGLMGAGEGDIRPPFVYLNSVGR